MLGLQLPVIPFSETVGRAGGTELKHNGPTGAKVGAITSVMLTDMVTSDPHCPASGLNVYGVLPNVVISITEGVQVPVIPLFEMFGNAGGVEV